MQRTVLVVDDEPKIRALVRGYLERDGHSVLEAGTAARALELVPGADLMILDLRLPDRAGEEVARQVRAAGDMPIIMVTAKADEAQRIAGLRLGADDYVTKPFSPRELVARVDAVLRRAAGTSVDATPVSFGGGALCIDAERREVSVDEHPVSLTRTEFDLLNTLAARPGRVWSRLELVRRVQREEQEAYERTIDVHVKNLRRKLADRPPRLVITVPGVGYKLGVDRDA
ncbi:response regulator transcription factor [Pseudonocardia nigra]|uniref:response regulator transcription factor n=1 Tax=Pseudonocardia nigra TaxID=1921578 RepID=UPI001C5D53BE|nr:response regulator transcription factor [Pseudonocardia nigra]